MDGKQQITELVRQNRGVASVAIPAIGSICHNFVDRMSGSLLEEGKTFNLLEEVREDGIAIGFGADIDGRLFLWKRVYPIGVIVSNASDVAWLVSWILQTRKG